LLTLQTSAKVSRPIIVYIDNSSSQVNIFIVTVSFVSFIRDADLRYEYRDKMCSNEFQVTYFNYSRALTI